MAERIASKVLRTQRHRGAYRSTYELAEVERAGENDGLRQRSGRVSCVVFLGFHLFLL